MAFYSVKVNEDGTEIDTPRTPTFRKATFRQESVDVNKELKSYVSKVSANQQAAGYKTVTYINSAAFIEKPSKKVPEKEPEPVSDPEPISTSNSNYENDMPDNPYQSHIETDFSIPLLELKSNESFPSSDSMDYSYHQVCEVTKLIRKPDAYKEWLDAKKMAKSYEKKRKEGEVEKTKQEKEERRRLAEARFQQWLSKKAENKSLINSELNRTSSGSETNLKGKSVLSKEEQKRNFNAWLKKKIENKKELRDRVNENLRLERSLAEKRKDESEKLYQEWLVKAPEKPKPVPLNQGFFTLKGTVSKIYVNPIPWQFEDNTNSSSL